MLPSSSGDSRSFVDNSAAGHYYLRRYFEVTRRDVHVHMEKNENKQRLSSHGTEGFRG